MPQRIVITGAGGLVGRVLADQARAEGRDVLALTSSECDITDAAAPAAVLRSGDVVVNCAAYTQVDAAEADPDRAHAVNAAGPGLLAEACARAGAGLVHISTDYVFSGDFGGTAPRPYDLDDPTGPLSVYGRTKLAGEQAVLTALPEARVVRTAWIYAGRDGGDFVATMRRKAADTEPVDVVADQMGSPTYVGDLVGALLQVVDGGASAPVLHAANEGAASRFDQARAVFEAVGADPALVRPVSSRDHPRPAPRPAYSALSGRQSAAAGLTLLRPWHAALVAALDDARRAAG
jgi:dTDP-4-dehydrorhamnose reductase